MEKRWRFAIGQKIKVKYCSMPLVIINRRTSYDQFTRDNPTFRKLYYVAECARSPGDWVEESQIIPIAENNKR